MIDIKTNPKKDISGCGIIGIMSQKGERFSGEEAIVAISTMRERSNGLGGGFAAYGIYPGLKDFYAFHIMYENAEAAKYAEEYINRNFHVEKKEVIPHRHDTIIKHHPLLRRYFVKPRPPKESTPDRIFEKLSEEEYVFRAVMKINKEIKDTFVFSSGKNMGIFKGVGYPEDIGRFFCLEEYKGYIWTAHGRFPTNSAAWWGGAHPFGLLDWSVVHNGEISSYGINKRYLLNFGYECNLFTDTEVLTYLFDLLVRRHNLSLEMVSSIIAAPFWDRIERMPSEEQKFFKTLRITYGSALVNGPFSIVVARKNAMLGLNDRIKLRPLIAAKFRDRIYIASEESAIREVCASPDRIWMPQAGEPVIGKLANQAEKCNTNSLVLHAEG